MRTNDNTSSLQKKLGYEFRDEKLITTALTHRSHDKNHNERLEYLGDSILGFIIAEALYHHFPDQPEGVLTRFRASLVKREPIFTCSCGGKPPHDYSLLFCMSKSGMVWDALESCAVPGVVFTLRAISLR